MLPRATVDAITSAVDRKDWKMVVKLKRQFEISQQQQQQQQLLQSTAADAVMGGE